MADLEKGIEARFAAHGLGALAGTPPRVYNVKAAQQPSPLPYIVFTELTVIRRHAMGVDTGVLETPVRVTTRAITLAEARLVDEQVRLCFSRFRGTVAGVVIQDTLIEGTEPDFDPDLAVHEVHTDLTFFSEGV